jgi:hypothetical protein
MDEHHTATTASEISSFNHDFLAAAVDNAVEDEAIRG